MLDSTLSERLRSAISPPPIEDYLSLFAWLISTMPAQLCLILAEQEEFAAEKDSAGARRTSRPLSRSRERSATGYVHPSSLELRTSMSSYGTRVMLSLS